MPLISPINGNLQIGGIGLAKKGGAGYDIEKLRGDMMFTGFTPETVDFLWGIRMNNCRDWFMEHKKQYVSTLYEPMKALGWELFQPFVDKSGHLLKVSRIYRDARLHHPLPYKESLWLCIRRSTENWAEQPCLFFEINPDGIFYGFSLWGPKPAMMKAFRKAIAAKPEEFLQIIRQAEEATGLQLEAETYARPEKCENPDLERFFLWKTHLGLTVTEPFSEATFGPELAQRVGTLFEKLTPLYEYFTRFAV
jgi:uncharacterized protein (TIGR02453 family)